ncbi:aminotransferase class V-fold PLP-dependent enzyme [Corynebacterium striatum]|uniref:aminotransferase class V-fold PLP-dependent enzyme n=1 Tax=Corynebacterium striatum TaxID=43770 RepID=UPI00062788FD|nr:aminotransferase class V-fold PLP-dependent enzyme [Corynebacterium striatum]KKO78964.1 cysteine desulfurase [Corynebacterium striatum]MDK7883966.1 aminotransferase class V-fold PLP-dependent enzyme [Corynebacterium striatum]MDK8813036.1 aminotransferase class V-fold PLP-dependent enzyme [Corynebacterium striatum]MDK8842972.1 aminotransferase class V-fold PLP-dependent enzyme [Corynebacterium striatum]
MPLGLPSRYDVASVRGLYTGLSDGWTYLNANAAPQISERVAAGVARSFRMSAAVAPQEDSTGAHSANRTPGQLEGARNYGAARMAIADLVGSKAGRVVLGPSLSALYQTLARSLRPMLRHNSSVVLSKLDPPALYTALAEVDADVRWAQPDLGTGELPAFQYAELVDGSTRLVSFSAAHELLGTVTPTAEILEAIRSRSRAWTLVDVSALAPYRPLEFDELGADILGIDIGLLGGPQIAALVFRDEAMFRRIESYSPAKTSHTAEKLETPVSTGLAGGVGPLVDHLAALAGGEAGSRRVRVHKSMDALSDYLGELTADLYTYLGTLPAVHILGVTGEAAAGASDDRLPRLTFAVQGVPAETVHRRLIDNGLVTTLASHTPLLTEMGADEIGGAVTVALGPFNTHHDVEQLTRVVASLA